MGAGIVGDASLPRPVSGGHDRSMLQLRPLCEHCAVDLPPSSTEAMICSYECTFCRTCVDDVLHDVCPNCGGGFAPRPIRPAESWVAGAGLQHAPPTRERVHRPVDLARQRDLVARIDGRAAASR